MSGSRAQPPPNRAGLPAIAYRIGTHDTFMAAMRARLSSPELPTLAGLKTRSVDDFSIALLDAWASVADILTFYQERIANEAYVGTAVERESLLEVSRLSARALRPAVGASTYLAYTMEPSAPPDRVTTIAQGSRAQSVPGPGQLPQTFETSEDLLVRGAWSMLRPRQTCPAQITADSDTMYLAGQPPNLRPGNRLLIVFGDGSTTPRTIAEVVPQPAAQRTLVRLEAKASSARFGFTAIPNVLRLAKVIEALPSPPGAPPVTDLPSSLTPLFEPGTDQSRQLLLALNPGRQRTLDEALGTAQPEVPGPSPSAPAAPLTGPTPGSDLPIVELLDTVAAPFGATAPLHDLKPPGPPTAANNEWNLDVPESNPGNTLLDLDREYPGVLAGRDLIIERASETAAAGAGAPAYPLVARIKAVETVSRSSYNLTAKVTRLTLDKAWLGSGDTKTAALRQISVWLPARQLQLSEIPAPDSVPAGEGAGAQEIELDAYYPDLTPGRLIIIAGELTTPSGVRAAEPLRLATIKHATPGVTAPPSSDPPHTIITVTPPLANTYVRSTVSIWGNVVAATQGETRSEILGSGDPTQANQKFKLRQSPLTYLPDSATGAMTSTLQVSVDGIPWTEIASLTDAGPSDRCYTTLTDNADKTTVTFGDGMHGLRPPRGLNNITARYRTGAGAGGNVDAGQVTQLVSRPLGVKGVTNPVAGTGGVDRESATDARALSATPVLALGRAVATGDYAALALQQPGIVKASAELIELRPAPLVHITVAAAGDAPVSDDALASVRESLRQQAHEAVAVHVAHRDLAVILMRASIAIEGSEPWETVEARVRAALFDRFAFANRALAQDVARSDVLAVIRAVPGVSEAEITALDAAAQSSTPAQLLEIGGRLSARETVVAKPGRFEETRAQATRGDPLDQIASLNLTGVEDLVELNPDLPSDTTKDGTLSRDRSLTVFKGLRPAQLLTLSEAVPGALVLTPVSS